MMPVVSLLIPALYKGFNMNKPHKKKLVELNSNNQNGNSNPILLFIAQVTSETNGNIKWLLWIAGVGITAGIGILIALAMRGL